MKLKGTKDLHFLVPTRGSKCLSDTHLMGLPLLTHMVKNLPAMQETRVRSLGQEDALEKKMATHSSILAWRIPWIEEPRGLHSQGHRV